MLTLILSLFNFAILYSLELIEYLSFNSIHLKLLFSPEKSYQKKETGQICE